jgi:photosystem II stability/assembly factor-like uncharacterized protein
MFRLPGSTLLVLLLSLLAGPAAAGVDRWTPIGPDGGSVSALAIDPAAPATLYAGTDGGGVWKSTDSGGRWASRSRGLGSPDVFALAVAPGHVLAGTGAGIDRSADGGATWQHVWSEANGQVLSLALDPTDPDVAWAGTNRNGILRSTDGGLTWSRAFESFQPVQSIAIDPDRIYTNNLRSTDGGATWQPMESHGETVLVDPRHPRTLLSGGLGVWKSTDAGVTWTQLLAIPGTIESLLLDPSDPDVLLAGPLGDLLRRSEDGGRTWTQIDVPTVAVVALAADPAHAGTFWLGSLGQGTFRSLNHGRTWAPRRRGLAATHVHSAAFDPRQPDTLYAAAEGDVLRSTNAGRTWQRVLEGPGGQAGSYLQEVAPHPVRQGLLFAAGGGAFRSTDRGTHWTGLGLTGGVASFAFDRLRKSFLFAAGENFYRSLDVGRTWTQIPLPPGPEESKVSRLVISELLPRGLFALTFNPRSGEATTLLRSGDLGNTWEAVFDRGAVDLVLDPVTRKLLYLVTSQLGEVWRSQDNGQTWELLAEGVGGGARLTAIVVDPQDPSNLYLGTDSQGVWRSTDRGITWAPFSPGLIAPRITCLRADPHSPHRLISCTLGGGLQEIRLPS